MAVTGRPRRRLNELSVGNADGLIEEAGKALDEAGAGGTETLAARAKAELETMLRDRWRTALEA